MRKPLSPLTLAAYAALSFLGLFLLHKGTTEQAMPYLMGGTISFTLGLLGIVLAVRSFRRRHV